MTVAVLLTAYGFAGWCLPLDTADGTGSTQSKGPLMTDDKQPQDIDQGHGSRATPTVQGARVYTLVATGVVNCLEADSG